MNNITNEDKIYYSIKFIVIGDQSVGKTNIISRFTKGEFSNNYIITIGLDYVSYNIKIDNKLFRLQIWDTAGSERFRSVTKGYYSNSACALIVYDITNEKSFDSIKEWVKECKLYSNKDIHLVLVGNKNDLQGMRIITKEQGEELAQEYEMSFFESSALTGNNINEIFIESCNIINNRINEGKYDFNDPSIGIKISKMENDTEIDKKIKSGFNASTNLDNEKHSKDGNSKCKC